MTSEKPQADHQAHAKARHEPKPGAEPRSPKESPPSGAEEIARLQEEVKQLKDQHLWMLADFENTKKRLYRDKEEFIQYAAEGMVHGLLPILDSLDRALVALEKQSDPQTIMQGVHLIHRQLLGLLDREGVKRIPTVGEAFDPHRHEAVGHSDAQEGMVDDTVMEEVRVGYTMHEKVIRPAMVKVAKRSADSTTEEREGDATQE